MSAEQDTKALSRRRYLMIQAMAGGSSWYVAREAVYSTALAHPEWDMDELRTWEEWEAAEP